MPPVLYFEINGAGICYSVPVFYKGSTFGINGLVFFSIVFIAMMVLMPSWALVWYLMEVVNVSGSAGDIYVTLKLWKDRKKDILVNDTGTEMTIYKRE